MKKVYQIIMILIAGVFSASAQQESQYSQYMYNTMTFNPGYTGSREVVSALGLYRTQWVGLEGAPTTLNFSIQSPLGWHANGIGLNVVSDQIGPVKNTAAMASFAYTILGGSDVKYSFGISGGFDNFTVDYNKLVIEHPDPSMTGVVSQFSPNVGVGFYVHADNWYAGISSPKLLKTSYFDDVKQTTYSTTSHYYFMGGYVFDLSPSLKFKPAVLTKFTSGSPLAVDVSANFLFNDKFTLGAAYRWDAAVSALAGFQITDGIQVGYAYDHDTTKLGNYNSGSHEFFIRFELIGTSRSKIVTPRFF